MTARSEDRQRNYAAVDVVMALAQPDGQVWKIPVTGSLVATKAVLNSGDHLVTLDVEGGEPIAVNPRHVAAIQIRHEAEVW